MDKLSSKNARFSKTDWLALLVIEFIWVAIFLGVFIFNEISFVYTTNSSDFIYQHVPLIENFRQLFYNSAKLIPEFIPNLGGGQDAFNYTYYGLFNPLILPFFALPWLSGYHYMVILMVIIALSIGALTYWWLKSRFSSCFTAIATTCVLFASCIYYNICSQYIFIDYIPFLLISLIGVDRLIYKKKFLTLIVGITLISLTNFVSLFPCCLIIGLWTIFVFAEKNDTLKNNVLNIKHLFLSIGQVILCAITSFCLTAFILFPTANCVLQTRSNTKTSFSLFDLFFPSLYFFPALGKGLYINRQINDVFSLGVAAISLIFIAILLFTKDKKFQILSGGFLILCIFPIFVYILNLGLYLENRFLMAFLPIFAILIAQALKIIYKNIPEKLYSNEIKFAKKINKKAFFSFIAAFLCLSTATFSIYSVTRNYSDRFLFSSKQAENLSNDLQKTACETLTQQNNPIYRSTISNIGIKPLVENSTFVDPTYYYNSINKVICPNYYTDSIYTSSNNSNWQNYHIKMLWQNPLTVFSPWVIHNSNSVFANTLLGQKYFLLEESDNITNRTGYKKINNYVWQNDQVFSIGYANNNLFSNIDNMTDIEQKAALIQGVSLPNLPDNNLKLPNTNNFNNFDLTNLFAEQQKGLSVFRLTNKLQKTYKLPEKLHNKLIFIKIKLSDIAAQQKDMSDRIVINNISTSFLSNPSYKSSDTQLRFIISPDEFLSDKDSFLESLKIEMSKGSYPIESIEAFTMPLADLETAYQKFDQMNVTQFSTDGLFGNINITKPNSVIAFSLGFDPAFILKIDGQKTPIFQANGGIIGAFISQGYHNIELSYSAPYYKTGIAISSITLMLLIGSIVTNKVRNIYKIRHEFKTSSKY
ncbi:MAG: YfhO family protein [Bifidobacteriaceae bacterium]|jgi:hypothetical protein|nr:YfhO family protein [Bifidobacteriaceae bacterium]